MNLVESGIAAEQLAFLLLTVSVEKGVEHVQANFNRERS